MLIRMTLKIVALFVSLLAITGMTLADEAVTTPVEPKPILSNVQVLEFVLTDKIVGREPQGKAETFKANAGEVYAFARLKSTENSRVTFLWFQEGKEHSRFTTHIPNSNKWRTFASIKLRAGAWKVQLLANDIVLAEQSFTVE